MLLWTVFLPGPKCNAVFAKGTRDCSARINILSSPLNPAPSHRIRLNLLFPHSGILRFAEPGVVDTKQVRHERSLLGRIYSWLRDEILCGEKSRKA